MLMLTFLFSILYLVLLNVYSDLCQMKMIIQTDAMKKRHILHTYNIYPLPARLVSLQLPAERKYLKYIFSPDDINQGRVRVIIENENYDNKQSQINYEKKTYKSSLTGNL